MKKQFTDKDRDSLKKSLQKFEQKGTVIVYGFAIKDSDSGVFSNERLILLNSAQKSIRYYSKEPAGLFFTKLQQIPEGKAKVIYDKDHFKCEAVKGKTSTMKIQWEQNKKIENWTFTFSKSPMMNEFVAAVQAAIAGTINKDPTFTNTPIAQPQVSNPPTNNTNPTNASVNNPQNSNQPGTAANKQEVKVPQSNNQPSNAPVKNQPIKSQPIKSEPIKNEPVRPQLMPSQSKPANTSSKQPSPPKEPQKVNSVSSNPQTSSLLGAPPTNPNTGNTGNINSTTNPTVNTNNNNYPNTNTTTNNWGNVNNTNANNPNYTSNTNNTNPNTNTQNNPQSGQYNDVSQEIRGLRQKNPEKFNLTNQLSKKNLHQNQNDTNFILENPKDNVETKRQPDSAQNMQTPPESAFMKSKQPEPQQNSRYSKYPSISQGSQKPQYPSISQGNQKPNANSSVKQLPGYQQKSIRNNPTNSYQEKDRLYDDFGNQEPEGKPMQRAQSQVPMYNTQKQHESRIKSEYGFDTNEKKKPLPKIVESKKWNEIWCTSTNPLEIHEEFIIECNKISKQIIDELPCLKSQRLYNPIKNQGPYYLYNLGGITYNMHYFGDEAKSQDSKRDEDDRAPLLFDHESYQETKRQFYNYNFILSLTGNKGQIKVPLSCYIQYKGVLIFCKANLPEFFEKVSPHQFERNLENLEQLLHLRFVFNQLSLFAHPQKKYFLLADLVELIPRIPLSVHPPAYFRKEFLLENSLMVEDQTGINKIFNKLVNENVKEFLTRFESFESWVINSNDLVKQIHQSGMSMACLQFIYDQTTLPFLKKIIISEMTKNVFCDILRSELNSAYASIPTNEVDDLTPEHISNIVIDCTHVLLNELFSYGSSSQSIWRVVVKQVNKRFKVVVSKEDIIPGYLLGGIMSAIGINCDYKEPNLSRKDSFFIRQNTIPREMILDFYSKVRRYDLDTVSPLVARVQDILNSEPSPDNFQQLVRSLHLKTKPIPSFCQPIKSEIITYLCNFIPLGDHEEFDHIGIYQMLQAEPHTYCSTKISLLGVKWAAKNKNDVLANKLFEIKSEQNSFWVSQFNPAISQFYDFFSLYNVSIGNYDEAVKLAKSSLINSIKLTGPNSLPVADKHYQLGNIFFKIGRKEEALKQYLKTKQILQQHKQTAIPQYGVILLKLSLLYLNFGKISDCVGSSLEALKIFDTNGGNEQEEIETFEILARSYEITRKSGDLASVGALCAQKFNNTENPKIFQRMMKIVLLPKLTTISHEDAKTLLKVISKLEQLESPVNQIDSFNYLHLRAQNEVIMKRLFNFIENISNLYEDIIRKDLFRRHKSLSNEVKSEAADMLVLLEAVLVMTGYNFVNGSLKQNYY